MTQTTKGPAAAEFSRLVDEYAAKGLPRDRAVARVVKDHPEAHRALLEEANGVRGADLYDNRYSR